MLQVRDGCNRTFFQASGRQSHTVARSVRHSAVQGRNSNKSRSINVRAGYADGFQYDYDDRSQFKPAQEWDSQQWQQGRGSSLGMVNRGSYSPTKAFLEVQTAQEWLNVFDTKVGEFDTSSRDCLQALRKLGEVSHFPDADWKCN